MSIFPALRVHTLLPLVICYAFALPAAADPFVTKAEAEAMVKKTVAYMKTNGRDKT
ncbi:hypothetical protein [Massilia pseudoviolaceinigra]|uniref:hypothetical protein n=1 Tax=Massilia pseudoviolaceinigra TaxID=3057165 RepID=UPI002796710A|nr:hypothetical protein [Massilia sp. CCM 9206]MDQ1923228.1 hypothetical protein [Massilia sp. CCM 9206]